MNTLDTFKNNKLFGTKKCEAFFSLYFSVFVAKTFTADKKILKAI